MKLFHQLPVFAFVLLSSACGVMMAQQPTRAATPNILLSTYINAVVNSASYAQGSAPGAFTTIFGVGLTGATAVLLNNVSLPILYNSDNQINFLVPYESQQGIVNISVVTGNGTTQVYPLTLYSVQPGLFYDSGSGYGSVLVNGTGSTTQQSPVSSGSTIEVFGTGFGSVFTSGQNLLLTSTSVLATIGGVNATVLFAGAAPGFTGLDQINVQVPAGLNSGTQPLKILINGVTSNTVQVQLR